MFNIEGEEDGLDADMVKLRAMLSRALDAQPTRLERITLAIIGSMDRGGMLGVRLPQSELAEIIVSLAESIHEKMSQSEEITALQSSHRDG